MTNSIVGEDTYEEPPLSQLEIPYKMHFSSSEDEKKKTQKTKEKQSRILKRDRNRGSVYDDSDSDDNSSSSSSSSSCGSFDSNPDRKVANREPLRVNDIISYTPPVFTTGTNVKKAVVLGIWPNNKSFPLILDTADMLPWDTNIQRIGEFYKDQIYKHSGRIKPLSSFRLQEGGTQDVTVGLQQKASTFKKMLQDMQQRAMATLRGEIKSPSKPQSPVLNQRTSKSKQEPSSARASNPFGSSRVQKEEEPASSDSDSSLSRMQPQLRSKDPKSTSTAAAKPVATTTSLPRKNSRIDSNDDDGFSSSSSNESDTLEQLKPKAPRGYNQKKRLSLSKNNIAKVTSPTTRRGGTNHRPVPKPQPTKRANNHKTTKQSSTTAKKIITVDDSSDDSSTFNSKTKRARGGQKSSSKSASKDASTKSSKPVRRAIITNLNDDTDSDGDDNLLPCSSKGQLVSKEAQDKMKQHRQARKSDSRPETNIWSGSDAESDHDTAGIFKTLEQHRQSQRRALASTDSLAKLPPHNNNNNNTSTGSSRGNKTTTGVQTNGKTNYSNQQLGIGSSSSSDDSKVAQKPATKVAPKKTTKMTELPNLPPGAMSNAALGLGSEDSSDDDDELFQTRVPFAKNKTNQQSPAEKKALYNRTNQRVSSTRRPTSFGVCYDADEDSENEEALLKKPSWHHNHSSERVVKSTPSKVKQSPPPRAKDPHQTATPTSSNRNSLFSKSPSSNQSRSRLVQDIRRHKLASPSPAKKQRYGLSSSSEEEARQCLTNKKQRRRRDGWSDDDCSIDSPEEEVQHIPTPRRSSSKKTKRKRRGDSSGEQKRKRKDQSDSQNLDFRSSDDEPPKRRGRKILTPKSKREKGTSPSSTKRSSQQFGMERPTTSYGRNHRKLGRKTN